MSAPVSRYGVVRVRQAIPWLAVTAAALPLLACGSSLKCGPGTRLSGSFCVPAAGDAGRQDAGSALDGGSPDGGALDAGQDAGPQTCSPYCVNRNCGSDGCGGSCGSCSSLAAPTCNTVLGICQATCTPACAGRNCGDDGCGGTCGACDGGSCNAAGLCVPASWTCPQNQYGAHDYCHCGCGAPDPDCAPDAGLAVLGCQAQQTCSPSGACVSLVPSS